jgi:hypothetical protein
VVFVFLVCVEGAKPEEEPRYYNGIIDLQTCFIPKVIVRMI